MTFETVLDRQSRRRRRQRRRCDEDWGCRVDVTGNVRYDGDTVEIRWKRGGVAMETAEATGGNSMSEPAIDSDMLINGSTGLDGAAVYGRPTVYRTSQKYISGYTITTYDLPRPHFHKRSIFQRIRVGSFLDCHMTTPCRFPITIS